MLKKYSLKKIVLIILGYFFFFLGFIGVFIPVFPTSPFLIIAYFCFAKGSDKFHDWFLSTELYKKYLKNFMDTKMLTMKQKLYITLPVTISLIISIFFVQHWYYTLSICLILIGIYAIFFGYIKTNPSAKTVETEMLKNKSSQEQ